MLNIYGLNSIKIVLSLMHHVKIQTVMSNGIISCITIDRSVKYSYTVHAMPPKLQAATRLICSRASHLQLPYNDFSVYSYLAIPFIIIIPRHGKTFFHPVN